MSDILLVYRIGIIYKKIIMNEIKIFENAQFGQIRIVVNENNEPLFCLLDLCNSLGLSNNRKVKSQLDEDVTLSYPP